VTDLSGRRVLARLFLAGLPDHVHVPELTILPARLQALGRTS
jgi:hypothetical protein